MNNFQVASPTSLSDVFSLLAEYGPDAALLAGGTDLLIHLRAGKCSPKLVILLRKVRDLSDKIEVTDKGVTIGAMVTLSDIIDHPVLSRRFPAIAEAAGKIGSKQIRNRGTLCGNVTNASPAADTMPPLYIYDAVVNVVGPDLRRAVPIASFIVAPGKTSLRSGEIVESIFCPRPSDISSSAYVKLARRDGIDISTVGVAAWTSESSEVRVALGAVGPTPLRASGAEGVLGRGLKNPELLDHGLDLVVATASPITDIRASRDYRLAMVRALARQAIQTSWDRGMATDWGRR